MDKIRAEEYRVRLKIVNKTGISLEVFDRIIAGTSALGLGFVLNKMDKLFKKNPPKVTFSK